MRGISFFRVGLFFSMFFLFSSSCFNKQDNDITKPNVPEYVLSGSTLDYVTGEPVPNTQLRIQSVAMLYDISFPTRTITSDSMGNYTIDPVYPGSYAIQIVKDDCLLKPIPIQIEHENRELSLDVPQILYGNQFPHSISYDWNGTFQMIDSSHPYFAMIGSKGLLLTRFYNNGTFIGFYFVTTDHKLTGWHYDTLTEIDFDPSDIWQLEVGRDHYYAIKYPDSLMIFDRWASQLQQTIATGIVMQDIAYNPYDKALYACTDSLLYRLENNTYNATLIAELPQAGMSAMTWNDDKLYLLRKYEDLVYQLNKQIQIEKIYAVANFSDNAVWNNIYDIYFDSSDRFWGTVR